MIQKLFGATIAVAVLTSPVLAAAPTPATVAAATTLVTQLNVRGQISQGMQQLVATMRSGAAMAQMFQNQPGFAVARSKQPAKFDEVLKKVGAMQAAAADKVVKEQTNAVVNAAIQSYARNYTAAELTALGSFYRSPLGIAMNTKQPLVVQEINVATQQLIGAKIQAAMQALGPQVQVELQRLQPSAAAK